ncbi:Uncharacterised protein [Acinetobacter baumannii]|nr:Uncharacterised protein [Acinetobacter baumannii]
MKFVVYRAIHMQRTVIYTAALVALVAYINHWMWIAGGALLVLLLCLIQTISAFHTRLLFLETAKQTVNVNESISVHDKFHRTLILSGFCLLKIAKISLNSSFFPKPIKR